jgi:hypothetical protein
MVTLKGSIYKEIILEIIRWNQLLKYGLAMLSS